jgi:hypothetical protein
VTQKNNDAPSPFIVGNMVIEPQDFFGRKKENQDIFVRLGKMGSTSIVGPRRIGKSSIAYYILKMGPVLLGDTYEFVWLDGQSNHSTSIDHFFNAVAKNSSLAYASKPNMTDCLIAFEDSITMHGKRLILIINEFELLTDDPRRDEFNKSFYNTMRLLAEQGHCALVTTSYESLKTLCQHVLGVSSPFYNIFEELNLKYFTAEETDEFLSSNHHGVTLSPKEIQFIKGKVKEHAHPLVLQIASDSVYRNRQDNKTDRTLLEEIEDRIKHYITHEAVREGRKMTQQQKNQSDTQRRLSKPIDLLVSIFLPVLGVGLIMLEYGLLIKTLTNFQAILLALVSTIVGFAVLVFAGRSIDIIGESTFFKIFTQLINQLPLFSSLADNVGRIADKMGKK